MNDYYGFLFELAKVKRLFFLAAPSFDYDPLPVSFYEANISNKQWKSMCSKTFAMKTFFLRSLASFVRSFFLLLLVMSEYIFMSFMAVLTKHRYCLVVSRFIRSLFFRHRHIQNFGVDVLLSHCSIRGLPNRTHLELIRNQMHLSFALFGFGFVAKNTPSILIHRQCETSWEKTEQF